MKKISILFLILAGMMALPSCGGGEAPAEKSTAAVVEEKVIEIDPMEQMMVRGEQIYKEKCVVCHQANGEGILHAFPPLKDSDYLFADKKRAVQQVLNGSHEEMVVNGITYTAPMPPQVDNHADAVAVINYVLNSWGNEEGYITLEEVKDIEIGPRW